MKPFFDLEFHGQTVPCHHAGYVNVSHLEHVIDARFKDFLAVPDPAWILRFGLGLNTGTTPIVQSKINASHPAANTRLGCDGLSDVWAHHALVDEFLCGANERELADWLWEHCCKLCWAEEICSMPQALMKPSENALRMLTLMNLETDVDLQDSENRPGVVQQRINANECFEPDFENGDHFGVVPPEILLDFSEILGQLNAVCRRETG